jgi:hypothetical protein
VIITSNVPDVCSAFIRCVVLQVVTNISDVCNAFNFSVHGVITKKTTIRILTTVLTSNGLNNEDALQHTLLDSKTLIQAGRTITFKVVRGFTQPHMMDEGLRSSSSYLIRLPYYSDCLISKCYMNG